MLVPALSWFKQAIFAALPLIFIAPSLTADEQGFLNALNNASIIGPIVTRDDLFYNYDILPWNLRCQPQPLAIVYVTSPRDVSLAVTIAAAYSVPVQPRSGGHSFGSYSLGGTDGALVVDLGALNSVQVNQTTWQATIGGGTRLDKVTDGLYSQGNRAIAHGTCPQVGIGGHATIGGQGPLSRMWGLALDHVVEVEVVIANGTIMRANQVQNSDIFWALRGAGASFGIITSFVVDTHPAPDVITHYSFQLTAGSPSDLAKAFQTWQTLISSPAVLDDRAFNSVITITKSAVLVQGSRFGSKAELETSAVYIYLTQNLGIQLESSELDWLASIIAWATQEIEDIAGGASIPLYVKNLVVRQSKPLTLATIEAWFDYMVAHAPDDSALTILADLEGGRISDFGNNATAYAQRDALYTIAAYAVGPVPYPQDTIDFLNGMMNTIMTAQPDGNFGAYPGYVDPLLPDSLWPEQYWGANYPRLKQIKTAYDPKNVFSNPQSVGRV